VIYSDYGRSSEYKSESKYMSTKIRVAQFYGDFCTALFQLTNAFVFLLLARVCLWFNGETIDFSVHNCIWKPGNFLKP